MRHITDSMMVEGGNWQWQHEIQRHCVALAPPTNHAIPTNDRPR